MSAATGDLLGVTCVMMPSGFNVAVVPVVVPTSSPPSRRVNTPGRAVEIEGTLYVGVLMRGSLAGSLAVGGELLMPARAEGGVAAVRVIEGTRIVKVVGSGSVRVRRRKEESEMLV